MQEILAISVPEGDNGNFFEDHTSTTAYILLWGDTKEPVEEYN